MVFSVPVTSQSSDRVLRPMIVTKQLDLPDSVQTEQPQQTPRTNLAKELEKYNRPMLEQSASTTGANTTPAKGTPPVKALKEPVHAPDRPNILSKKPHYRPQYRYDPTGTSSSQESCTSSPTGGAPPPAPLNLSVKEPSVDDNGTLDLSMKTKPGSESETTESQESSSASEPLAQEEPMDFSKKTLDSQAAAQAAATLVSMSFGGPQAVSASTCPMEITKPEPTVVNCQPPTLLTNPLKIPCSVRPGTVTMALPIPVVTHSLLPPTHPAGSMATILNTPSLPCLSQANQGIIRYNPGPIPNPLASPVSVTPGSTAGMPGLIRIGSPSSQLELASPQGESTPAAGNSSTSSSSSDSRRLSQGDIYPFSPLGHGPQSDGAADIEMDDTEEPLISEPESPSFERLMIRMDGSPSTNQQPHGSPDAFVFR